MCYDDFKFQFWFLVHDNLFGVSVSFLVSLDLPSMGRSTSAVLDWSVHSWVDVGRFFGDLLAELPSRNLAVYYQKCPSKRMIYLNLAIKYYDFLNLPSLTHAKNTHLSG